MITIYDCKIELAWAGTASDGTAVEGTVSIPEVSHEVTLDKLSNYVVRIQARIPSAHTPLTPMPRSTDGA